MKKDHKVNTRRVGFVAVFLAAGWLLLGVYVLHAAVEPGNPVLPFERALGIDRLLPQRWTVFTINPKAEYPLPYRRRGETWIPVEPSYRGRQFGFDRAIVSSITEADELTRGLDEPDWIRCDRTLAECVAGRSPVEVRNDSNVPRLCGDIAVAKRSVTPWNDRSRGPLSGPFDAVLLKVLCP